MTTHKITSTFADVDSVVDAIRPAWTANSERWTDGPWHATEHASARFEHGGASAELRKGYSMRWLEDGPAVEIDESEPRITFRGANPNEADGTVSIDDARSLIAVLQRAIELHDSNT